MWTDDRLHLARIGPPTAPDLLGPGRRIPFWAQGCGRTPACPGCTSPAWIPFHEAPSSQVPEEMCDPAAFACWLFDQDVPVTCSGGEPFDQARPLAEAFRIWKEELGSPHDLMVYTGYTLEELRNGSPDQRRMLQFIDLLVDGPFVQELAEDLLWRGSSNQRILALSDRYTSDQVAAWNRMSAVRSKLQYDIQIDLDRRVSMGRAGIPHTLRQSSIRSRED